MRYRLGLDLGTNSLGWWIWEVDGGVRIFSDGRNPKDKTSLATARRVPRGMRRRRDRYLKRRQRLMDDLVALGLMPAEPEDRKKLEALDPYRLRRKALDEPLSAEELGRALFHLNQRRGFKSNRKADPGGDRDDEGVLRAGVAKLDEAMASQGARTLGEFLYRRQRRREGTRARPEAGFYPERRHYEAEFAGIRAAQEAHQALSHEDWDRLAVTIFYQRTLRPVDPGYCTLLPDEARAPRALPITQRFRILEETANLRVRTPATGERVLTSAEVARLRGLLLRQGKLTFDRMRRVLDFDAEHRFNLESEKRRHLVGDETAHVLRSKKHFGRAWDRMAASAQTEVVKFLLDAESEDDVLAKATGEWGLDEDRARTVSHVRLPPGYGRLSEKALVALSEAMGERPLRYDEAVRHVFPDGHHSDFRWQGDLLGELPPYPKVLARHLVGSGDPGASDIFERLGRVSNPTVHIGLNQVRRLVNAVIRKHGRPTNIVVELARDLKTSAEQRREIERRQAEQQRANEQRKTDIEECGRQWTPDLLRRLRLWEEQGLPQERFCPYCGRTIGFNAVLGSEFEIDHVLPFSRTLDDGFANKVVSCNTCNRLKRDRTPAEAFQDNPGYDYEAILRRAERLPANKRWRFMPDAMAQFEKEHDFIDRQLNETRYLARITRAYLESICADVRVTPGALTALLRRRWGLNGILSDSNRKERTDHRHHAVDAAVISLVDRAMLQRVSQAAGRGADSGRLIAEMPEPASCPEFRSQVEQQLRDMVVWHKPDHTVPGQVAGTSGRLHNDTAYGVRRGPDEDGHYEVAFRKPLSALSPAKLTWIVDGPLRDKLQHLQHRMESGGHTWGEFVAEAGRPGVVSRFGVQRVRMLDRMRQVVQVHDAQGRPYKAFKTNGNAFTEIFQTGDGRWRAETVSIFDANQVGYEPRWHLRWPGGRFVMRLHKNDLVATGSGAERRILRVVKLTDQKITLADAHEADTRNRGVEFTKSANSLRADGLRRVGIDELGKVKDPGPRLALTH